jgi:hypothetical protein
VTLTLPPIAVRLRVISAGCAAGDKVTLKICPCDAYHVPLPRQALMEAGDLIVKNLKITSSLDYR